MTALARRTWLFAGYSVCLGVANAAVLRALYDLSRRDETASHLVFVPLVTLALIWQRRDSIFSTVRSGVRFGALLVLLGLAVSSVGRAEDAFATDRLTVLMLGFVLLWIGGFVLFFGTSAFRAALFPLLFLGLAIPIPTEVLERATLLLKNASTEIVAGLFTLTGTPFHREGFVFALPDFVIEVADECSGIRSSIGLFLTSLLAGNMLLRSWSNRALLVLAMLPLAVLKNGIRIVSLSLLAEHVNPRFLTGQLHHEGGIVFYLLALGIASPFFVLLVNSERTLQKEAR